MEVEKIKKLIENGENDSVEFKEYVPGKWEDLKSKVPIAVCALANTNGGTLIIGVSKDGKIVSKENLCPPRRFLGRAKSA
jgi:predicted HTH transcriptional regulator